MNPVLVADKVWLGYYLSQTGEKVLLVRGQMNIVSTTALTPTVPVTNAMLAYLGITTGFNLTYWNAMVNGATAWTTTTTVTFQDLAGVALFTIGVAALTANAQVWPWSANVTLGDAAILGGTAAKGFQVIADANAGAGSNLVLNYGGYYRF